MTADESAHVRVGIFGASGYAGGELVRLLAPDPGIELAALTADRHAGRKLGAVFPHLGHLNLPELQRIEDVSADSLDVIFTALPQGTTQEIVAALPAGVRVVDFSADFRLRDPAAYAAWYGREHAAPHLQATAVYGLTELYRREIAQARLIANPGCYTTTAELALMPLLSRGLILPNDIVIDGKSGVSGAGRAAKEHLLFAEVGEGTHPYGVAGHRHAAEIEQELSAAAQTPVTVNFTPHLLPMNRGILASCYVRLADGASAADLRAAWDKQYGGEPFVHVLPEGQWPATRQVRGSNHVLLNAADDRVPGRAIVLAALDNLVKGASGQAIQNMNVMMGRRETAALEQAALFP